MVFDHANIYFTTTRLPLASSWVCWGGGGDKNSVLPLLSQLVVRLGRVHIASPILLDACVGEIIAQDWPHHQR